MENLRQNALAQLMSRVTVLPQQQAPIHPQLQNMLAGLIGGSDVMSPADRAAYYQATGENISGSSEGAPVRASSYQPQASTQTVNPNEVARYMEQRRMENEEFQRQRAAELEAARNAPKRTYYGD